MLRAHRFWNTSRLVGGLVGGTALATEAGVVRNDTAPTSLPTTDPEFIGVYLTQESQQRVNKMLQKKGLKDASVSFVSFRSALDNDSAYVYKPLFGQRAAFRLKGILRVDDPSAPSAQMAVGVGRISTMVGELKDHDFVASLPVFRTPSFSAANSVDSAQPGTAGVASSDLRLMMDLPTRLLRTSPDVQEKPTWRGRLPSGSVLGRSYGAANKASYVRLSPAEQVVVDGYICSSGSVDEEGRCLSEREELVASMQAAASEEVESRKTNSVGSGTSHSSKGINNSNDSVGATTDIPAVEAEASVNPQDKSECPVCKYMKAGSCKDQFEAWEGCLDKLNKSNDDDITKCVGPTVQMMRCMKDDEYYDIMTAGTDYRKIDIIADNEEKVSESSSAAP